MFTPIPLDLNIFLPAFVFDARNTDRNVIILTLKNLIGCQKRVINYRIAL